MLRLPIMVLARLYDAISTGHGSRAPHQPVKTLRLFSKNGVVTSTSNCKFNSIFFNFIKTTTAAEYPYLYQSFAEELKTVSGTNSWVEGIKTIASITGGTFGSGYGGFLLVQV